MADYVVRLTGKDDLSSTVNQVRKELSEVGNVGSDAMEKIDKKFNRIVNSSAPLKKQLRDLKNIMADMNLKGLNNTDEFTKIAEAAGQIKDAMDDASEAMNKYSSDTFKLDASIQVLQGVAAAGSIATGAMALFGSENKEAAQAIQKVQGALGILNGIQALANTLNENSTLMLRIKTAMMNANNTATKVNTAGIVANTVATTVNTTAAKAWNTTKAIGKALLGDFSGLLLVGAAALVTYSIATNKSQDAQENLNASTKKGSEVQSQYASTLSNTYSNLMTKYTQLRTEWNKLSNDHQRSEWIKKNKSQFDELQISVDNVSDAERAFNGNTDAVVQAFVKRAKAAARLAQLTELYRKQIELIDKRNQTATQIQADAARSGRRAKAGDEITDQTFRSSRYGSVSSDGKWRFSEQGAKLYSGTDTSSNKVIQSIDSEIDGVNREIGKVVDAIQDESSVPILSGGSGGSSSSGSRNNNSGNNKKEFIKGSLSDLENQLNELQSKLKNGLIPADKIDETKVEIENLKNDILKKKIELGLEIDPKLKEDEERKKKIIEEVNKWFENNTTTELPAPQLSSFENAMGENPFDTSTLEGIENLMNFNDDLIDKLKETKTILEELKQALKDAGLEGSEAFNQINDRLNSVDSSLIKVQGEQDILSEKARKTNEEEKKKEQTIKTYEEIGDAAQNTASIISSLANATDDQTFQTAAIIAEAIANIIAGYASASAQASELGPWGWAAFSLAGLAQVASVISQIHSLSGYADGGIITGGSNHGDTILSRLNAGEMVLSPRQQSNLFKAIDSGDFGFDNGSSELPSIQFKIKGSDLYGSLKNYSKTVGKVGKITGIK